MSKLYHDKLREYLEDRILFGEATSLYDSFYDPSLEGLQGKEKAELEYKLLKKREDITRGLIMDHEHPQCSEEQKIKIEAALGKYMIDSAVSYLERYSDIFSHRTV